MFSTIVTVNAEDIETRMLTPRMQRYCVKAFNIRKKSCRGIWRLRIEDGMGSGER